MVHMHSEGDDFIFEIDEGHKFIFRVKLKDGTTEDLYVIGRVEKK